ncbi:MAG TPA: SPOR domain-containing protein [Stellaceae bacterium]|nr:SPOR domain-containing protein [Stellaceae bacterium]
MQRHRFILVLAPILLGGCAIPPAISIASYVLDGISYAATGKSVSDHGISAVAGRDCATFRILKGQNPCRGEPTEIPDPAPVDAGQQATLPTGEPAPAVASTLAETPAAAALPAATPRQHYLVLGSYDTRGSADEIAMQFSDTKATVFEVKVDGRAAHRVVAGPLTDTEVADLRERLVSHDGQRAWEVNQLALAPEPRSVAPTIERH